MQLVINKELKNLIPPLTPEEYNQLEQNLLQDGCRDPLVVWDNTLIDGHNRFEICTKHNIKFETINKDFADIDQAKIFIIDLQLGRRNLPEFVQIELKTFKKDILLKIGKENLKLSEGRGKKGLSITDKGFTKHNTQKEIAKDLNISTGKLAQAEVVIKRAPEEVKEKLRRGVITINEAYKIVKTEDKKEQRRLDAEIGKKKKIDIDFRLGDFEKVLADIPDGSIDCIITDPPYPYEFIDTWSKLSLFAKRVLKPNGYCITYSGQMNLPEVIKRMSENLDYYWTFAVYHEGQTQIVNGVNLICRWKPVLIYQNGKKKLPNTFQDYFISEKREKDGHDWQQSKSGVSYLIEMFTNEGDSIIDPFAGSGTTLIVGRKMNRNVIGAEIDEQSYNIAKNGIANAIS